MDVFLIAQIIGFVVVVIEIASWQLKKRSRILHCQLWTPVLFFIHSLLLGAYTGAAYNLFSLVRIYLFLKKWKTRRVLYVFLLAMLVTAWFTWEGYRSVFAIVGGILWTIAIWQRKENTMRKIALVSYMFWFVYHVLVMSYAGMVLNCLGFISALFGIWRFGVKK